jgi:hypothetical protein
MKAQPGKGLASLPPSNEDHVKATRSVLICHHDEPLNRFGLARWPASFTDLAAIIILREPRARLLRRIRRELSGEV